MRRSGQAVGSSVCSTGTVFVSVCWLEVPTDLATFATLSWVAWVPLAVLARGPQRATVLDEERAVEHGEVTTPGSRARP